ncbi:MAG: hypothetical protein ACUVQU_07370 [Candidatus Bipolaricaulia bacterium]
MKRIFFAAFLLSLVFALPALGASLEELARQRIVQETGLDPDLVATIFVSEENAQFILTFIYINERTFNSRLKPELLEAIAPYRGQKAMLTLVTPARESYFNPGLITFSQGGVEYHVAHGATRQINEGFKAGTLPTGKVAAGVILLERLEPSLGSSREATSLGLDVSRPFTIGYMSYTTNFALSAEPALAFGLEVGYSDLLQLLLYGLLNLLLFLLFGFLV